MGRVVDVRVLDESEHRRAHTLFRAAVHQPPAKDDMWERAVKGSFVPGRTLGGFEGGNLIGSTYSFPMPMIVPGGAAVPTAAVTRVGVRADRTRRGVLTALMREQLAAIAAAGEPIATLRASEYPIYGRFGYGVASRGRDVEIDSPRVSMHPNAPGGGSIRLLDRDEFGTVLPQLYRSIDGRRPGTLQRSDMWWQLMLNHPDDEHPGCVAIHTGPNGDDGFVAYHAQRDSTPGDPWGLRLQVDDLHAASVAATAALWRFVAGVDLISSVRGWYRPLDEPIELLLDDARACRTIEINDETWLRLVDVDAALSARSWGEADPVVIAVDDALLPANSGGYCVTPDGVKRTDEPAQLALTVAELGRLYLGDLSPSMLASVGRLTVQDQAALPAADALFATGAVPWAGTFF
jgi:predicted acetyltransferase